MDVESLGIAAGILAGAVFFVALYLLAREKAAKTGRRTLPLFARCLSALSLVQGIALSLVTPVVLQCTPLFVGPVPDADRLWMNGMIAGGFVFFFLGAMGLWLTRQPPASASA